MLTGRRDHAHVTVRKMSSVRVPSSLGQVGRSQIEGKAVSCVKLFVSLEYCTSDVVPQTSIALIQL